MADARTQPLADEFAAQDHNGRVEEIEKARDADAEILGRLLDDAEPERVTRQGRLLDIVRVDLPSRQGAVE